MATPVNGLSRRRKLAFIVSNANYYHPDNKLNNSHPNAVALRNVLNTIKFDVTMHLDVFTDIDMKTNIRRFAGKIRDDDIVLFYFCGHGSQVNNKNYLLPVNDALIESGMDIEDKATPVEVVIKRLVENVKSCVTIVILDCCRPYWPKNTSTSRTKGLKEMKAPARAFIQFACAANKTVRNEFFSKHLLRNIVKQNINIVDVFQRTVDTVYRESNKTQQPLTINGCDQAGEIYLNNVKINGTIAGGNGFGNTFDRLHSPQGVCLTSEGDLLVADSSNHRIMKYKERAKSGRRIAGEKIDGYADNRLCRPSSAVCDRESKHFIISDYQNRRISKWWHAQGKFNKIISSSINCFGIAMDDEGAVYVSDPERHEVRRFQADDKCATLVAGGHGQGGRLQQLNHPTYIFIDQDQSLYVSDSWNNRIMKWEKGAIKGVVVAGGNGKGRDRTQLDGPAGLFVDSLGRIYVADHHNHRVMRWSHDAKHGEIILGDQYLPGDSEQELNGPEGLTLDEDGYLYVADSLNHRIQRIAIKAD